MKKNFTLLVFVSAALFFGFGQAAPANAQSYPASQCTSLGGSYASDAASCPNNTFDGGGYLNSACQETGRCCLPSGTFNASNPLPAPQVCNAQTCTSTPGGTCGYFIPSGYTPGAGTCPSGQQCFIPGAGGTCASQGGLCVVGNCSQVGRRSATGSCIGPDATKTCCTAQTFPSCTGSCRTGSCNSGERADGNAVCTNAYAICCVVAQPGVVVTGPNLGNYTLLEQLPGSSNPVTTGGRLNTYLEDIYRFAFWAVGIAVVFMLTIGGFMYLTSAGNTSRMESAKTVIFDAILGLVLALVAWLFLYVINPDLVNVNLPAVTVTPVTPPPPATTGGNNQTLAGQIQAGVPGLTLSSAGDCRSAAGTVSPASSIAQSAAAAPVIACQSGCPGSGQCSRTTALSETMLRALIRVSSQYPMTVNSFTGGSHSSTSLHYSGRAVDIIPADPNRNNWEAIAAAFRNEGAQAFCDNGTRSPCNVATHIHAHW